MKDCYTKKTFLRWEPFSKGAGLDECGVIWYIDNKQEERFYLHTEDNRHFLRADYDSLEYFQIMIARVKNQYQITFDKFFLFVQTMYPNEGWNTDASEMVQQYCSELEAYQHKIECYWMILNELRRRNENNVKGFDL